MNRTPAAIPRYDYYPIDQITNRGTSTGGPASTLAYNPDDQLCWSDAATITSPYCHDVPTDATTTTGTAHDTWNQTTPVPLLLTDGTNDYLYGPDGTPIEQIDSTGTITGTATYDPYGTLTTSTGTLSPLGYDGQYTDPATGLIYLRARYYDPTTAQFLTPTPSPTPPTNPTNTPTTTPSTTPTHSDRAGAGIGIGVQWSNARIPSQLEGESAYVNGSVVMGPLAGAYAGASGFIGRGPCDSNTVGLESDSGISIRLPIPAGAGAGISHTLAWSIW